MQDPRFRQAVGLYQQGETDKAESLCRQILEHQPDDFETRRLLSVLHAAAGRIEEAMADIRRMLDARPDDVQMQMTLASLLRQSGDLPGSEQILRDVLAAHPNIAAVHSNLANLLVESGRRQEAIDAYKDALKCDPQFVDALYNLGTTQMEIGELEEAAKQFERCVELQPSDADAAYNLGLIKTALNIPGAELAFQRALQVRPNSDQVQFAYAMWLSRNGHHHEMRRHFKKAIELKPDEPRYRIPYARAVSQCLMLGEDVSFERDLLELFAYDGINLEFLFLPALSVLRHKAAFPLLTENGEVVTIETMPATELAGALCEPLLINILAHCLCADPKLESLLRTCRRRLLTDTGAFEDGNGLDEFRQAMAHQVWVNEYLWSEDDAETRKIDELVGSDPLDRALLPLLACYRPLAALPEHIVEAMRANPDCKEICREQLDDVEEMKTIADSLPTLAAIEDAVSISVREQYESHPYPRWQSASLASGQTIAAEMLSIFPLLDPSTLPAPANPQILIAGCGTGRHSIETASSYKNSDVLAVDLSRASLAYAKLRSDRLSNGNIEYLHADILDLDQLDRRFNLIESSGVLHHMADPMAGWRVLTHLLTDDGLMRIGLYSALGRQSIQQARAQLTADLAGTNENIRAVRRELLALPDNDPLADVRKSSDFYSLSSCRDLIFHVQEHCFSLPQIAESLDELDLELIGFDLGAPWIGNLYRERYPRDQRMIDLECWHELENEYPQIFAGMYQFVVRKKAE